MIYPIRSPRCAEFVGFLSACAHIVVQTSLDRLSSSARWRIPPHLAPAGHARRSNTLTNCLPQLERLIASYSFRKHHQIGQVPMSPLLTWPEAISPAEFPTGSAGFFAAELFATGRWQKMRRSYRNHARGLRTPYETRRQIVCRCGWTLVRGLWRASYFKL